MILRMCALLLLAGIPALADLSSRWSTGGTGIFVLRQKGNTVTGTIVGKPGEPTYKIMESFAEIESTSSSCMKTKTIPK